MTERDVLIPAAVMSVLRCDDSVRGVADRFGVTEAQVREWLDIFVVAGVLALTEFRTSRSTAGRHSSLRPTTPRPPTYSTTPPRHHYSTPPPGQCDGE